MANTKVRIGLFGIGLDTYWPQFNGLLDRLTGYQKEIVGKLRGPGVQLVDAGMVDNPQKADANFRVCHDVFWVVLVAQGLERIRRGGDKNLPTS